MKYTDFIIIIVVTQVFIFSVHIPRDYEVEGCVDRRA